MRFAGDYFGVPLAVPGDSQESELVKYFPDLKDIGNQRTSDQDGGPRNLGGTKAIAPFTGFKTMESTGDGKQAPEFFGYKTFEY